MLGRLLDLLTLTSVCVCLFVCHLTLDLTLTLILTLTLTRKTMLSWKVQIKLLMVGESGNNIYSPALSSLVSRFRARVSVRGYGLQWGLGLGSRVIDSLDWTGLDWTELNKTMSLKVIVWFKIRVRLCFCEASVVLWVWIRVRLGSFVPSCPVVVCRGCVLPSSLALPCHSRRCCDCCVFCVVLSSS